MKKRSETPKRQIEETPRGGTNGGRYGGNNGNKRRCFQPQDITKKVPNNSNCKECQLSPNEQFRDLFHPGNIRNLRKTERNGVVLCMRFHTLGYCFSDYKYKIGHGTLGDAEPEMKSFVPQARTNLQQFCCNGNNNREQPQDTTPPKITGEIHEIE